MDQDVSLILVSDGTGRFLFGKRRDNNLWTLPGGHLNPGESSEDGARRELMEETALSPISLSYLASSPLSGGGTLYCYTALSGGIPHGRKDPDQECEIWEWVDCRGGIPSNIFDNLHGPEDDSNLVRRLFDLKKGELEWDGYLDLRPLLKSENALLHHPDPAERKLAVKLGSVTSSDLAAAVLDPHESVWKQAFKHPHSGLALTALSHTTRDAAGDWIFDRHDALMGDPRVTPGHIRGMFTAILNDRYIPHSVAATRLMLLSDHPKAPKNLTKASDQDKYIHSYSAPKEEHVVDSSKETNPPHLGEYVDSFMSHLHGPNPVKSLDLDAHLPTDQGYMPKAIYKLPHRDGHAKVLVKPYHDKDEGLTGWAEGTSQALYHAGDIGRIHQKSFTVPHGQGPHRTDVRAIVMEPSRGIEDVGYKELEKNPQHASDARKMVTMDFLTGNIDRHEGNLMVHDKGHLLAIDHGEAFQYDGLPSRFSDYKNDSAAGELDDMDGLENGYHQDALPWWKDNGHKIRQAMEDRASLLKDPERKNEVLSHFKARADWLDSKAKENAPQSPEWNEQEVVPDEGLSKSLGDIGFMANRGSKDQYGNDKLMSAHPESHAADVNHFETHLGTSSKVHAPISGNIGGVEPKAVYGHADKKYIVKPMNSHIMGPHAGWNEMTSQALYHAGGIGNLHQKAHVTKQGDDHGLVIHMAPGAVSMAQAYDNPSLMENTKKHKDSFSKIHLMDILTNNSDRHSDNLMINSDGSPMAIDHGAAFYVDHQIASGGLDHKDSGRFYSSPHEYGIAKNHGHDLNHEPTWNWWNDNKEAISNKFKEHAQMIPDKEYGEEVLHSFNNRVKFVDDLQSAYKNNQPHLPGLESQDQPKVPRRVVDVGAPLTDRTQPQVFGPEDFMSQTKK